MSQLSYGTGDISNGLLVFENELFKVNNKNRYFQYFTSLWNWIEYISLRCALRWAMIGIGIYAHI